MKHNLLFTGHMVDAKNRESPRFPAAKEDAAREAIRKVLLDEKEKHREELTGIAGGASGGDILFHELCAAMNIPTQLYLALPKEAFKKESVSFAGKDWEARFEALTEKLPMRTLPEGANGDSVWERANLWMLQEALEGGGNNMTLIALWNGQGGDGRGGTAHMVNVARENGAEIKIIDVNKL